MALQDYQEELDKIKAEIEEEDFDNFKNDTKTEPPQEFKVGDKTYTPEQIKELEEKANATLEEQAKFKENLVKANQLLSGEELSDDDFDAEKFVNDKEYRDSMISAIADKKIEEKLKDKPFLTQDEQAQSIGMIKYNTEKEKIKNTFKRLDIHFNYDKYEKRINEMIQKRYTPEYIRDNFRKVVFDTISIITKKPQLSQILQDGFDDETVSSIPFGYNKGIDEQTEKAKIINARAPYSNGSSNKGNGVFW